MLTTKINHIHRYIIQTMGFIDIESFNDKINFIRAYFKKYPIRLLVRKFKAGKALSFRDGVHCEIKNLLKMEVMRGFARLVIFVDL